MYKAFNLSSVKQDAANKKLQLKFNFDIDKDTIGPDTFNLVSSEGAHVDFSWDVVDDVVYLELKDWPEPNSVYQLIIRNDIKSISGQQLKNALRYNVVFESHITSVVTIKSPYNFQKVEDLTIEWEESESVGKYKVEIAEENRFYNLIYDAVVTENKIELTIPDMKPGQYYLRVRVTDNNEYGKWSNIVTFIYKDICDCDQSKEDGPSANAEMPSAWSDLFGNGSEYVNGDITNISDSVKPEIEDELEIITMPEQGVTPASFIFETDKELDPNFGEVVIIKRDF